MREILFLVFAGLIGVTVHIWLWLRKHKDDDGKPH